MRDFFEKTGNINGTFNARMGTIKDRDGMDLTEAEEIKKRWQEYTEELYKKGLNDPDNHDGMATRLEPDILECELRGFRKHYYQKTREVIEFQLSYFKSLKMVL